MGQTASSTTDAPPLLPPPRALTPAQRKLADHAPLDCVFYYESKVVSAKLRLPLLYNLPPPTDNEAEQEETNDAIGTANGTRLMDLELWLRDQFAIPPGASVFAVAPADEPYSPPYPLVLLNTVAATLFASHDDNNATSPVPPLRLALVVRSMALLRQPVARGDDPESPYYPISAALLGQREDSIARQFARRRFLAHMQQYGFARLEVSPAQAQIPQKAFDSVRAWLVRQLAREKSDRWRDKVDARPESTDDTNHDDKHDTVTSRVSKGRYVGFNADRNREYLQLRRPIAASGTVWPPAYFATDPQEYAFANEMLVLQELLDTLARDCMRAICELLNLDEQWMMHTVLDDPTPPPKTEAEVINVDKSYQYGASVLRVYNYRNKAGSTNPDDASCAVHADLGLVTVSPVATVPGLQMWNMDRMTWTDVEADAGPLHFSVFAGETLGLMTNGLIKAPLHRVPPIAVDGEDQRRMSMPYFLRARPEVVLNPHAPPAKQITCRDFMEEVVYRNRPWRREDKTNAIDY